MTYIPRKIKSYFFTSPVGSSGTYYKAGFYDLVSADANLTQASTTVTLGSANHPYAAHAFIVSGGNGTTDGSDLVLTVSGTSITDAGVRATSDTQVVVADATDSAINTYAETPKKWIGTVTYTLTSTGGTTFSYDFNYGFSKYEDFGNRDITLTDFEFVGLAGATDTGFEIEVIKHDSSDWAYAATGFTYKTASYKFTTDHSTESDLTNGQDFAWKRTNLSDQINAISSEGIVIAITTTANKAVEDLDIHLGVNYRS